MSTEANAQIISVIGGCRRAGRWLVPSKTKVMTFFGRATIDLREAQTTADELSFDCMSAFASITFIVPEGAEIRPSGMAILASARSDVPVEIGGCHLPKIAIDAITLFGRFRIVTGESLEADERADEHHATIEVGADLADTTPVDEPARPTIEPYRPVEEAIGERRSDTIEERSPIHDVTVPDSPAAVSLDTRPEPLPESDAEPDEDQEPGLEDDSPDADAEADAEIDADAITDAITDADADAGVEVDEAAVESEAEEVSA